MTRFLLKANVVTKTGTGPIESGLAITRVDEEVNSKTSCCACLEGMGRVVR